MSRNKVNQTDGSLTMVAGRGKAEYGASTVRKNTFNQVVGTGTFEVISIAFSTPMPDADYVVDFTFDSDSTTTAFSYAVSNKTASGFDITFGNQFSQAQRYKGTVTAFKLYTDTEYNEVLERARGKVLASVTANGVKSYQTLINELANACFDEINSADKSYDTTLFVGESVFHSRGMISTDIVRYSNCAINPFTSAATVSHFGVSKNLSNCTYFEGATTSTGSDISSNVPANGTVIKIVRH